MNTVFSAIKRYLNNTALIFGLLLILIPIADLIKGVLNAELAWSVPLTVGVYMLSTFICGYYAGRKRD